MARLFSGVKRPYFTLDLNLKGARKHIEPMQPIYPYFTMTALSASTLPTQRLCSGNEREHYDIIWIREGQGSYIVDQSKYAIGPNSLLCGASGQYQQLIIEQPVAGVLISFNRDFIHQGYDSDGSFSAAILHDFMSVTIAQLRECDAAELSPLFQRMQQEWMSGLQMKMEILTCYLHILLIHVRRIGSARMPEASSANTIVRRFLTQIEKDFIKRKAVSDYASLFCVTANYLNQIVKQQIGGTAGYYIRSRVIAEAKRRAMHSDQNMKQIAYSLGFISEAHFSKYFKNYTGVSFSEFKRNCFHVSHSIHTRNA
jgi:AraC family transcriptional regulator, transcriptional activator of pobA